MRIESPSVSLLEPFRKMYLRIFNYIVGGKEMPVEKLDTKMFARAMGHTLAVLHWSVGIDANDVEFVLGSSRQVGLNAPSDATGIRTASKDTAARYYRADLQRRTVSVWVLDFNQCKRFEKNTAGLKQLVDGFWWNDPYYPRPEDKDLWSSFSEQYLKTSLEFVEDPMPKAFIDRIAEDGRERSVGGLFGG